MSNRNIKNLPLLEAFDAIMSRGSISQAAEAMNVTQSAVSKQLGQLRGWFEDDLFVRTTTGMQPTPRAVEIREQARAILQLAGKLTPDREVAPATFSGRFVLSATDEILARLTPTLLNRFAQDAPQMKLVTLPLVKDYLVRQMEAGQVNLVVAVNWNAPETLVQKRLTSDDFVCVMRRDHLLAKQNLTLNRYVSATHVLVAPLGGDKGVVDLELEKHGKKRHVCGSVSAFNMVTPDLLGNSRIATVPSIVAEDLVRDGVCVLKKLPLKVRPTHYFAIWHSRFSAEPRLRWVLRAVEEAFRDRP